MAYRASSKLPPLPKHHKANYPNREGIVQLQWSRSTAGAKNRFLGSLWLTVRGASDRGATSNAPVSISNTELRGSRLLLCWWGTGVLKVAPLLSLPLLNMKFHDCFNLIYAGGCPQKEHRFPNFPFPDAISMAAHAFMALRDQLDPGTDPAGTTKKKKKIRF